MSADQNEERLQRFRTLGPLQGEIGGLGATITSCTLMDFASVAKRFFMGVQP
jgi:hypothetical protein